MNKKEILDTFSGNEAIIGWDKRVDPTDETRAYGYIDGYKTAADELVEKGMPDLLVFPIAFCYRQYLELVLKNVYKRHPACLSFQAFLKQDGHDLKKIFADVSPILLSQCGIQQEDIDEIGKVIDDFTSIDSDSFSFRYDYTKNDISTLDSKLGKNGELRIDLAALKDNIKMVNDLLIATYDK